MVLTNTTSKVLFHFLIFSLIVQLGYGYNTNNTKQETPMIPLVFSVQGLVICNSGSKFFPLKGGVVRITCLGVDKYGYETAPFSIMSRPTDSNGYFLSKLSAWRLEEIDGCKITQCKAFLHSSSLKTCQFPTNINNGSTGAPISSYRAVGSDGFRLYSVGPFVYSTKPQQSIPAGY